MNYTDSSGHGILSKIKSAAKKVATTVKNTYNKAKTWVKNTYNKAKNWVSNTYQNAKKALTNVVSSSSSSEKNKSGKSSSGGRYSSGGSNAGNRKYSSSSRGSGKSNFYRPSTYERAKSFGQSRYNWFSSKMKESGNIRNSWTKAIEKTVRKFCTTANRIKKDAVKSVKAANIAIGISAITIGKMKLEQLKKEEEKRLTTIAEKDQQIKQLRESIANLNFVTNSKAIENSYYNLSDLLNAAIADKWSIETTKLDIRAKTVFNNTVFVNSISDIINMKSYLSNQFGADIFNTNEYEYRKENHCEKIAKLVQFAIKEDERFLNFKQGKTTKEFLLAILKNCFAIEYDIKKGSDSIHTMSEGKKGIVILQLYLSLSQADCPILIDQPEDNLDNRTVYQDLNDYIKQCKRKRQIIMVSHNANLVVNTDAENIIVANQTGENGSENRKYRFEYVNGSLENTFTNSKETAILYKQGIREHVCEILEGGVDAFKKREDKYHIKN